MSNHDLKKVIQAYEETGMQISTTTASDFADLIGRYSADWVIEAIKAANRAGRDHVRVNYITGILRNWQERGGPEGTKMASSQDDIYEKLGPDYDPDNPYAIWSKS